jgi:mRNA-degrading endonuclease RelE of RelBE toxin-antitoxin system
MASVVLAEPAANFLKAVGADIHATILRKLHDLESEPERRGKSLAGELSAYRSIHAAGRYRIIYRTEGQTVFVVAIGHRKDGDRDDVYAALKRSLRRRQ